MSFKHKEICNIDIYGDTENYIAMAVFISTNKKNIFYLSCPKSYCPMS